MKETVEAMQAWTTVVVLLGKPLWRRLIDLWEFGMFQQIFEIIYYI